ncbi:hypothetical protein KFK09_012466 [Dendrobium nobile]|uniref:Expansin-like EG45 domain-containing protein n=1 Tax=Dendrobium nobile TaxID=94219 RepID=A0A8T3BHH9_DENNO|nr:hypothetical protein KFK09_012466 [Dendrobium nobile]
MRKKNCLVRLTALWRNFGALRCSSLYHHDVMMLKPIMLGTTQCCGSKSRALWRSALYCFSQQTFQHWSAWDYSVGGSSTQCRDTQVHNTGTFPFFAFAVQGTAKACPASSILFPCTKSSGGSFDHTAIAYPAKASDTLWGNGTACGKYYCVMCNGGANLGQPSSCKGEAYAFVIIQANCPNYEATMNISREGFAAIADPNAASTIKITDAEYEQN